MYYGPKYITELAYKQGVLVYKEV